MTEEQWLACTDPTPMLEFVYSIHGFSDRQERLYCVAVCRRIWGHLQDERLRTGIEFAEKYVDGLVDSRRMGLTLSAVLDACMANHPVFPTATAPPALVAAYWAVTSGAYALECVQAAARTAADADEPRIQAALLRDILGNPFRERVIQESWRTPEVVALATTIYVERQFDLMAAFGAALSDAGCRDTGILEHCGGPGPHVKGCFLLDMLLGKE